MSAADLATAEGHLDIALRHLETAYALVSQDEVARELGAAERFELNGATAEAGVLVDRISSTVAGRDLAGQLAALMDTPDQIGR